MLWALMFMDMTVWKEPRGFTSFIDVYVHVTLRANNSTSSTLGTVFCRVSLSCEQKQKEETRYR